MEIEKCLTVYVMTGECELKDWHCLRCPLYMAAHASANKCRLLEIHCPKSVSVLDIVFTFEYI